MQQYSFADVPMQAHYGLDPTQRKLVEDGITGRLFFPNGYGISVIRFGNDMRTCSHGATEGLYEVAVLLQKTGRVYNKTSLVSHGTLGYQTENDVSELMNRIAALPPHGESDTEGNDDEDEDDY